MITGSDWDIDHPTAPSGAKRMHVVYFDNEQNVLQTPTIWAETIYPLTLIQALFVFKPIMAIGANVNFEYADGTHSVTTVFDLT
jgi:hypothetical protein